MTPEELLAAHFAVPHSCCWIVSTRDGAVQCGLYCGHDGDHLDYLPGEYLPPPLLHPLDVLPLYVSSMRLPWWIIACPICGRQQHSWNVDMEAAQLVGRRDGDGWRCESETWWRFEVCGCEARELLP